MVCIFAVASLQTEKEIMIIMSLLIWRQCLQAYDSKGVWFTHHAHFSSSGAILTTFMRYCLHINMVVVHLLENLMRLCCILNFTQYHLY